MASFVFHSPPCSKPTFLNTHPFIKQPTNPSRHRLHATSNDETTSADTTNNNTPSPPRPPPPPPGTINIRYRSKKQAQRQQQQQQMSGSTLLRPPPPKKEWEEMTLGEKAVELYVGEKGLLFWLNKFAYASIFIVIGAWILFRFVGPSIGLYQLDAEPLSPSNIFKGSGSGPP